jgi:hypothetical protein
VVADVMTRALARTPEPPKGWFPVVTGSVKVAATARALASGLGLPLLSWETVQRALGAGEADLDAIDRVLFAVAADSPGAVIGLPTATGRAGHLRRLPGQVVEVSCDGNGRDDADWPVVARSPAAPDADALVRLVRQVTADA